MKEIKYTFFYCVCENFRDSILLRSGSAKAKSYGSYDSGSSYATLNLMFILKKII